MSPNPTWRMLALQVMRLGASRTKPMTDINIDASLVMIEITTSNSMRVNPRRRFS